MFNFFQASTLIFLGYLICVNVQQIQLVLFILFSGIHFTLQFFEYNFFNIVIIFQKVLKADNTNFNAYVYCAQAFSALQDDEKAVKALKKALDLRNDQIVPWLMLCKIYESKSITKEVYRELMVVYDNLLQMEE